LLVFHNSQLQRCCGAFFPLLWLLSRPLVLLWLLLWLLDLCSKRLSADGNAHITCVFCLQRCHVPSKPRPTAGSSNTCCSCRDGCFTGAADAEGLPQLCCLFLQALWALLLKGDAPECRESAVPSTLQHLRQFSTCFCKQTAAAACQSASCCWQQRQQLHHSIVRPQQLQQCRGGQHAYARQASCCDQTQWHEVPPAELP
jgi:hypothetical protein